MEQTTTHINVITFESLAQELHKASQLRKQLEMKEKDLMDKLKDLTGHLPYRCESFALRQISRPGSVDYNAIPLLKGFDFTPFRKPEITYFKLEKIDIESERLLSEVLS
jgi:hypothetical protein